MKRVLLDTNIFLRHLVKDNPEQAKEATKIFASVESGKIKGIVSLLVVNEVLWTLEKYYAVPKETGISELIKLLLLENIQIMEVKKDKLIIILQHMRTTNYDFTDLYLFHTAGSREIISFDKDFQRLKRS